MKVLKDIFANFKQSMESFTVSFYGSIAIFLLLSFQIIYEYDETFIVRCIFAIMFAVLLSLVLQIYSNARNWDKTKDIAQKIVSGVSAVPCFFVIHNIMESDYVAMGYIGVLIVLIVLAIYLMYSNYDREYVFPQIVKAAFFSGIVSSLFFGGIALCLLALDFLVVKLPQSEKWYIITAFASYVVLAYNLFISMLPKKYEYEEHKDVFIDKVDNVKVRKEVPKLFKVLVLYVAFPIYALLLLILSVYLIKILVTWQMPQGQINIFSSLASLFFIFFYLDLGVFENKYVRFYKKYAGWFLLPIIAAQAIAIYIRVDADGLTAARYASILLNITALLFIISTLIKDGKYAKYVMLFFAALVLVSSIGPLNILDVPIYDQTYRMEAVLNRNDMLINNKIVHSQKELNKEDIEALSSAYRYIIYSDKKPEYLSADISFYDIFGFEIYSEYGYGDKFDNKYFNAFNEFEFIDISGYNRLENFHAYGPNIEIEIDGNVYDVKDHIMRIERDNKDPGMVFDVTEDIRLYLLYMHYELNNKGDVQYFSAEGFALIR